VQVVLREVDAILEANPALKADEVFHQAILKALEKARENVLESQLRDMLNHLAFFPQVLQALLDIQPFLHNL